MALCSTAAMAANLPPFQGALGASSQRRIAPSYGLPSALQCRLTIADNAAAMWLERVTHSLAWNPAAPVVAVPRKDQESAEPRLN